MDLTGPGAIAPGLGQAGGPSFRRPMWGQRQDGDSWEPQGPSVGPGQRGTQPLTAHRTEGGGRGPHDQ